MYNVCVTVFEFFLFFRCINWCMSVLKGRSIFKNTCNIFRCNVILSTICEMNYGYYQIIKLKQKLGDRFKTLSDPSDIFHNITTVDQWQDVQEYYINKYSKTIKGKHMLFSIFRYIRCTMISIINIKASDCNLQFITRTNTIHLRKNKGE